MMVNLSTPSTTLNNSNNEKGKDYHFALTSLTTLFFLWGFITCLNDILIPHLKAVFNLSYGQAMLIQFCFFGAYFLVSIPASKIVAKHGFQKGIVIGLIAAAIGCAMFYPAASLHSYPVFLAALFTLASGITILQVSANPYVSALGPADTASSRLTMTQAFNSLGTTVAPFFGAYLILEQASGAMSAAESAQSVQLPYLLLAAILLLLAVIFSWLKLPDVEQFNTAETAEQAKGNAWQHRHLSLGALAIFIYVGAEVAIGSFLVSFLSLENIASLGESEGAKYIAYYWGGALIGRFVGAIIMQKIAAGKVLAFNAFAAVLLLAIVLCTNGNVAMVAILSLGLCNSIMFPTIFSLSLSGLGKLTSQGSGILCLAIVGGAIVPLAQGFLADEIGVQTAFILPMFCYLYIAYYGVSGHKINIKK
jgi:FHS family L-fucose permease-like MFS transporter